MTDIAPVWTPRVLQIRLHSAKEIVKKNLAMRSVKCFFSDSVNRLKH